MAATMTDSSDWKHFDFESIRREAMEMFDQHNRTGVRISGMMRQDSLDYWIAVVAWQRAKSEKTPMGSTRWR
jgi:hypothetical protein